MYQNNRKSEFTKHAANHILNIASQYALSCRDHDNDGPQLDELSIAGSMLIKRFVRATFPNCTISKIRQVYAPQMYGMYMLRHENMKLAVGNNVQEKLLFHVTTESRAMESLNSGLDWRLANRDEFGCGVSFSDNADYANNYFENSHSEEPRVIMLCTVLVKETYVVPKQVVGNTLVLPPGRADTTVSHNGRVYVKYNDNEFCPRFFVYYRKRPEHRTKSKCFTANKCRATVLRYLNGRYSHIRLEQTCSDYRDAVDDENA